MSGQAGNFEKGGGLSEGLGGVREVKVAYMNVGRSCDATHEFLEGCARRGVGVAFVGECWVERKGGRGTQSHPDYMRMGVSGWRRRLPVLYFGPWSGYAVWWRGRIILSACR